MYKVIYIDRVTGHRTNIPSSIKDGDNYFTIGWGGIGARKFKEYNPETKVECWKTDYKAKKIFQRELAGVTFKIFPAINIKYFGDYSRSLLRHLRNELRKNEPVVFNISSFRHLLFYSVAFNLKNYPLVVQNNGESPAIYKIKMPGALKKFLYYFHLPLEKKAFRNIDLLYILDERLKSFLPKTDATIKKQTLGVITERFNPIDKKEAKRLLNLDPEKKYLLYVGKLNYTKRPDILVDIYRDIKNQRDDIELLIVGTNEEDPLINYAKDAGAKVFGRVMHTEMYKFLSAAEVYILPKYSMEHIFGGIGLLPVEALLCNTPIIGGSLENFPPECRKDVGIALSEPDEMKKAIMNIIERKITFNKLRETAIQYYSWENIISKTSEDYKNLLTKYYG